MHADKRMQGKKVLVTGSGTGIGKEIALEFARQGADVVIIVPKIVGIFFGTSSPGQLVLK